MQLSHRLTAIAEMVSPGRILADIGTDHGYVPLYLCRKDLILSAIAADINEGPLLRAKSHIEEAGESDRIQTRLSDGLAGILPGEADCILIAGMGGMLVKRILTEGAETAAAAEELVLAPQSDVDQVRRWLRENGWKIIREEMVEEDGKYYPIFKAVHGTSKEAPSLEDQMIWDLYGELALKEKHPVLKEYLEKENSGKLMLMVRLQLAETEHARERLSEVAGEIALCDLALKYYR